MKTTPFKILCLSGLFAIFSSTISKSPVLPLFAVSLGADPSRVGMVAAVSAFTGIIASIPAGMLSDRIGRKRMLLFSGIVFSTAPVLYLFVTSLWQLALVRFYHGFSTAIFIPVAMALVSDLFQRERGESMGWFSTSTLLGRFMAPIAGGSIIGSGLLLGMGSSYKAVYVVCGAAGALALLLLLRIPDTASKKEPVRWADTFGALKGVLSNRTIVVTCLVEAAILFAYGTFETFLPLYSKSVGLSAYSIGIFLSAQVITLALSKPSMGRFSDRKGRRPQILAGALIGAVCIGVFPLFRSFIPLLLVSIFFGLSLSIVTSATSAYIADMSRQGSHGSAMGVLGSIMDIGHTTGPLVSGLVATAFGYGGSFAGASAVLVAAAVLFALA